MKRSLAAFAALAIAAAGCSTSRSSVPAPTSDLPHFSFARLAGSPVTVRVLDHRSDPAQSTEWISRVASDVRDALRNAGVPVSDAAPNILEIRVNTLRSDFELGNWNGCAKLTGDLQMSGARLPITAERCVKKGNLWGYKTADNVMSMAYRDSLADFLSSLDSQLR